ncbi:sensor kinase [Salmonella enterica subsp. enterica]|uniref:Sensor kinase n=1 Tax=Salmonella enterica I TaxID=59201 RepID=A0A447MTG3_SALET|nr:sensor kinase [Salmonella enterica subsp. enterica]
MIWSLIAKIFQSLDLLLADIENAVSAGQKIDQLIHTLKGCLGQIGQTELVCYVIDIENRVKMGKIIALEELTDLRQKNTYDLQKLHHYLILS